MQNRQGGAGRRRGLLLVLLAAGARAQVLDDSTKVLYGPKTTRVIYEAEVLRDSDVRRYVTGSAP